MSASISTQIGPDLFCCADCGHDTKMLGERYMVTAELWEWLTYYEPAYALCVLCGERRLGRQFRSDDFLACPLNYSGKYDQSQLLADRLTRRSDK